MMASPKRLSYKVNLWVRSPFLFRGPHSSLFGVDAVALRDEAGRAIIPADQVRGVVRDVLTEFARIDYGPGHAALGDVFGRKSDDTDPARSNDPIRARIDFTDLTAVAWSPDPDDAELAERTVFDVATETTRVEIDDELGAAVTGMLQVIELVVPFGAGVKFEGKISVYDDSDRASQWREWLERALRAITSIGGLKSPGFGEVIASRTIVEAAKSTTSPPAPRIPDSADRIRLRVTFDRPILIDAERKADNAFQGRYVLPGAAFKGALAMALDFGGGDPETGPLGATLSAMSFSHAFPECRHRWNKDLSEAEHVGPTGVMAGRPFPLSLAGTHFGPDAKTGASLTKFADALRRPNGVTFEHTRDKSRRQAGVFVADWKPIMFAQAAQVLEMPYFDEPPLLSRTHTAINSETGAAKDEQLFTTISRSVVDGDGPRSWLIDIDISTLSTPERKTAIELVQSMLESGLHNIGKTGASAAFDLVDKPKFDRALPIAGTTDRYAVMLTTPALMTDPTTMVVGNHWAQSPKDAYAAYWATLGARMHGFFAAQEYRGGYQSRRRRLFGPNTYHPFLLTSPGSIFEIETADPDLVNSWIARGLPPLVPKGVDRLDWRNCPFVPENGFGRVTADYLSGALGEDLLRGVAV